MRSLGGSSVALVIIAKAPVPGRVKTRLCPPCTPDQAATLAGAALADTLDAALAADAARRVLVLDGDPAPYRGRGFELLAQRGGGLDARLAGAFADVGGPALLIGMDTPQVTSALLDHGLGCLRAGAPAVLGRAQDGGYWALGLREPDPRLLVGVPMSTPRTAIAQLARLRAHGRSPVLLPTLRDVDSMVDARAVAAAAPATRLAAAVAALDLRRAA